jgi:hypothetical protein
MISPSETIQFEAIKVAMKQDKTGYILTLNIHPDEIPEDLMRDFVGARYQFVAVRLNSDETPYPRRNGAVSAAGILCRSPNFWDWLVFMDEITEKTEAAVVDALHRIVGISSRSELNKPEAQERYDEMVTEFKRWEKDKVPF